MFFQNNNIWVSSVCLCVRRICICHQFSVFHIFPSHLLCVEKRILFRSNFLFVFSRGKIYLLGNGNCVSEPTIFLDNIRLFWEKKNQYMNEEMLVFSFYIFLFFFFHSNALKVIMVNCLLWGFFQICMKWKSTERRCERSVLLHNSVSRRFLRVCFSNFPRNTSQFSLRQTYINIAYYAVSDCKTESHFIPIILRI